MNVKKGDYVVFKAQDETKEGLVIGSTMGKSEIMTKECNYEVTADEIIKVKGNVLDTWKEL